MLKIRIIKLVIAAAIVTGIIGGTGVVANELGFAVTSQAHACASSGAGGGGC